MRLQTRRLTFEVGPPSSSYKFQVRKRVCGIEVGIGLEGVETDYDRFVLELCRRGNYFLNSVRSIFQWCDKLGVELNDFHVQFVFPAALGPTLRGGRAVVGRRGRAVLEIEATILDGQLGVCTIDSDPLNRERIFCEDIVPHELMHILDVRQGRSPSLYPSVLPGEGEWLDLGWAGPYEGLRVVESDTPSQFSGHPRRQSVRILLLVGSPLRRGRGIDCAGSFHIVRLCQADSFPLFMAMAMSFQSSPLPVIRYNRSILG